MRVRVRNWVTQKDLRVELLLLYMEKSQQCRLLVDTEKDLGHLGGIRSFR